MIEERVDEIVEATREQFEEIVFAERFLASIERNPESRMGATDFMSKDCPPKAELLRRDEKGNYVDPQISAIWFGWRLRTKCNMLLG